MYAFKYCPHLCYYIGKAIEVFEHEQVTFYFCNEMEEKGLFFNVLCLEETGIATYNNWI